MQVEGTATLLAIGYRPPPFPDHSIRAMYSPIPPPSFGINMFRSTQLDMESATSKIRHQTKKQVGAGGRKSDM